MNSWPEVGREEEKINWPICFALWLRLRKSDGSEKNVQLQLHQDDGGLCSILLTYLC